MQMTEKNLLILMIMSTENSYEIFIFIISEVLLKFSVEWITNAKTSFAAVMVLNLFQHTYDFQDLLKIPDMPSFTRDLLPYLGKTKILTTCILFKKK